jgi:hypothetical protein
MDNLRNIIRENITIKEKTYELPTRKSSTDIIPGDIVEYKAPPVQPQAPHPIPGQLPPPPPKVALRDFEEGMGIVVKVNNKTKKVTLGVLENKGRSTADNEKTKWGLSGEKVEVLMKDCQLIKKKEDIPQALIKAVVKLAKLGWKGAKIALGTAAAPVAGALAAGAAARGFAGLGDKYQDK